MIALKILSGILLLALQNCHAARWVNGKSKLSIGLSAAGTLIFIAAMQPYAAVFAFGFAVLGLVQLVQRRSLFKVDRSILALGGFYIAVLAVYLFFEEVAINYRPVRIGGNLEASYPSSTTMLALCVLPTAMMQLNGRIRGTAVRRTVLVTLGALTAFMVVGRLISGAHWLTDIIGGVLLSVGLALVYNAAT